MPRTTTELLARWDMLKTNRRNHEDAWDEIITLMQPFRGDIRTTKAEGTNRIGSIFDATAMLAADTFTNFLKGTIIPSGSDWVRLRAKNAVNDSELGLELKALFDRASNTILTALSASNFYVEAAAFLKDFGVVGNAALLVEEQEPYGDGSFRGLNFEAISLKRMWWQNGRKRRPFFIVREFDMPATDAESFFGPGVSPTAHEKMRISKPMATVDFAHFVFENEEGKLGALVPGPDKPWQSVYVDVKAKQAIRTGGFNYNPYIISRWMVVDGEEYGRGRGHLARPTAKGVNELTAQSLLAMGRMMDPTLVMEDDSIIEGDVVPGGTVYIRPWQKQAPDYLRIGTDLRFIQERIVLDQQQITRAFLGDVFEDPETQPRSAEESRQRLIRAQQRLAAPAESVDYDFATPLMECLIGKLSDAGMLPELEEAADLGGVEMEVVFQSPFFTSQKNAQVQRVYSFLSRRIGLFQATQDEAWIDDLDPDAIRSLDAELSDVPARIFRTPEEVEERRMARASRAAEERIAAQQQGGGSSPSRNPVPAQQIEELA